jgi:hypothetical protein
MRFQIAIAIVALVEQSVPINHLNLSGAAIYNNRIQIPGESCYAF